jgi:hypothetical protein
MRRSLYFSYIALLIFAGTALAQPAPSEQDLKSPAWWLQRAQAEANAVTDAAIRRNIQQEVWTFGGSAADPRHFAEAVDDFLKDLASNKDPASQAAAAINYGRLVARLGTAQQARAVVAAGREAAAKMSDAVGREAYLGFLAGIQADSGDAAGAIAAVGMLTDPWARAGGYAQLAALFGKKGDTPNYKQCVALAVQALGHAKDPLEASGLMAKLVDAQVAAGDEAGARESAGRITDPWQAAGAHLALSRLAGLSPEARAKEWSAAEGLAVTLPDARMADTMAAIAQARSEAGDAAGARRTLELAEKAAEALQRDVRRSWLSLALAWGRLGDKAAEVRLLKRAGPAQPGPNDVSARPADDLLAIAQAYRDLGDFDTAGRAAEAAHRAAAAQSPPAARVDAWEHVADADARAGDLARWRQDLASGLGALAQVKPGDPAGAPPPADAYRQLLTQSAVANLALAGKINEARGLAGESATPEARVGTLTAAAHSAAVAGDFTASRALGEGLGLADRVDAANEAGYTAGRAGRVADASRELPRYATPEERGSVATGVAQGLLEQQFGLPPVIEP